jgi:hypothetical protein
VAALVARAALEAQPLVSRCALPGCGRLLALRRGRPRKFCRDRPCQSRADQLAMRAGFSAVQAWLDAGAPVLEPERERGSVLAARRALARKRARRDHRP